jgi:hypothetical protein
MTKGTERSSKAYLIMGSAHLGIDPLIGSVLGTLAKTYGATPVHLGPFMPESVIKEHKSALVELDKNLKIAKPNAVQKAKRKFLLSEVKKGAKVQQKYIDDIKIYFGKCFFVLNENQYIERNFGVGAAVMADSMKLGDHLHLSSVMPSTDKASNSPITKRSIRAYKKTGKSWILPHPIPAADSQPRAGLNQAYNYITTGSLSNSDIAKRPQDFNKAVQSPAVVLVVVDEKNGEFHAKHLHIDYATHPVSKKSEPVIMDDGVVFFKDRTLVVPSKDKAAHVTDSHSQYEHMGVLASIRMLNNMFEPETFVDGGDTSDFASVNRHAKDRPGEREGLRLSDDINNLRKYLDALGEAPSIKNKVLVDSNHHEWLSAFISENPNLKGLCDWPTLAKTVFHDWDVFIRQGGSDKTFYFGDIAIRHGDNESGPIQANDNFGKYLGGHYHRYMSFLRAVFVGPACKLGPKYLNNKLTAWQNQVTLLTKYREVAAAVPRTVLHDDKRNVSRVVFRNKIYEIPFHKYSK